MSRRSICSAGFFASVVVVLMTVLAGCTDPNMQVNDPSNTHTREFESRTPR